MAIQRALIVADRERDFQFSRYYVAPATSGSFTPTLHTPTSGCTHNSRGCHHHHIAGVYLARYAQESAFREGHRRADNGTQVTNVARLALAARPSVDFCGYWQRAQ